MSRSFVYNLAASLGLTGIATVALDIFTTFNVSDTSWAQGVVVLAILAAFFWRSLPDQNDTPGPDVLEGEPMDWKALFRNLFARPVAAVGAALLVFATAMLVACGPYQYAVRSCQPAYSENCFEVQGEITRREATAEIVSKPDVSASVEAWVDGPGGLSTAGSAYVDPAFKPPKAGAEACIDLILWERCFSTED